MDREYDAIVVGAGPNGLSAAIVLAQAGWSVVVYEARESVGGGARTGELTLPGFRHDICSAIHPFALHSPFFRSLPLEQYGLEWIQPDLALAHPLDDGSAAVLAQSLAITGESLGKDRAAYEQLMGPLVAHWQVITEAVLGPLRLRNMLHPLALTHFGLNAIVSAQALAKRHFTGVHAKALLAGIAAHSLLRLDQPPSAAAGLLLAGAGHVVGWPIPRGGSQMIVEALAGYLRSLGGKIVTGVEIKTIDELPAARTLLFDVTPKQLLRIAGQRFPERFRRELERFRYGPGSFKLDIALDGAIPWKAEACLRAGTVHLGGTIEEIALSEWQVAKGQLPERPYVLVAQQSLFDPTRAPAGKHTVWAYCHVPNGSTSDMTERIEQQIERFAPGFRERILARHTTNAIELEQYNPNYIGGDINGGIQDFRQLFTRPTRRVVPYSTPAKNIYICSSSTPPGGGVHGLCGFFAAQAVLASIVSGG